MKKAVFYTEVQLLAIQNKQFKWLLNEATN